MLECLTWVMHKYIMHGCLWCLHKDHHFNSTHNHLEKNDLFLLIFIIPCLMFVFLGIKNDQSWLISIGISFGVYACLYIFSHEIIMHSRIANLSHLNPYFKMLRKGHQVHHLYTGKNPGAVYGILYVSKKCRRKLNDPKNSFFRAN